LITRPHGVRGELKVKLFNEDSDALSCASHLVVEPPRGRPEKIAIASVRGSSRGPILALQGVAGHEAAEALRGARLWVERSVLPELSEGEYYLVDLVGCAVILEGSTLGRVEAVRPDPSVDTMIIALEDGRKIEQPIVDAWVGTVDMQARTVELLSQDGWIEG
jgi:16S rRNA processing protein RimM